MLDQSLNEREFELVNIIGGQIVANQRDLSRYMNISLGMTNMLLRRLVTKGFIRIQQLNRRKVEYILTPKGFTEKMRKSIRYTLKTINSITLVKQRIKNLLELKVQSGERCFVVVGHSDLAMLIEVILKEMKRDDVTVRFVADVPLETTGALILICKEEMVVAASEKSLNLIHELAKDDFFLMKNR